MKINPKTTWLPLPVKPRSGVDFALTARRGYGLIHGRGVSETMAMKWTLILIGALLCTGCAGMYGGVGVSTLAEESTTK